MPASQYPTTFSLPAITNCSFTRLNIIGLKTQFVSLVDLGTWPKNFFKTYDLFNIVLYM